VKIQDGNPVENARQEKMSFVDTDPHYQDGVPYKVTYESSGLVTAEAPVKPKVVDVTIGEYVDWSVQDVLSGVVSCTEKHQDFAAFEGGKGTGERR